MRRFLTFAIVGTAAALVVVPAAAAHVTVNPNEATAGSFSRFAIRVPTERPADTTAVSLQLPEGLFFVSFQPKPGWTREVKMETLDPPVELFGNEYTERVAEVSWTGGKIGPGEFDEFGMSARMPEAEPGTALVFPAVQTYSTGEVVRWIGEADAETPAPRVTVLAAPAEEGEEEAAGSSDDSSRENLALGIAIAGLVAGLAALGLGLYRRSA